METLCRRSRDALHWEGLLSAKVDNIMRSRKAGMKTQGKVVNEYMTPVMTRGSETRVLATALMDALAVAPEEAEADCAGNNTL